MRGFVDLHCHFVPGIDDGARSTESGLAMLRGLREVGFDVVVATPHMRPGMFENDRAALERAYEAMRVHVANAPEVPAIGLASEHFFDDVVFARLGRGEGLPYPSLDALPLDPEARARVGARAAGHGGKRGVLVELSPQGFPPFLAHRFFDLGRLGLRPVLAHPERYQPVWKDDACLDPLVDAGAALLLDVCALVGKYGRAAQRAAEKLLEEDGYEAACSDAHRPEDVPVVRDAVARLERAVGPAEADRLLRVAPRDLLG